MQKIENKYSIKIDNLFAIYNSKSENSFCALKDFSYSFPKNKIICIIGESGSGKSTLISFFNGLSKPEFGNIQIENFKLNSNKNLNNILIANIDINNKSIIEKKYSYIVQVSKDTSFNNLRLAVLSNLGIEPKKIKRISKKKLNINNNIQDSFYLLVFSKEVNFDLKTIKISEIKNSNLLFKTEKKHIFKKIKNYKELRKKIGMVFQFPEYQLFKSTVIDDVMFGPINLGFKKKEAQERSIVALNKVGIKKNFWNYSPFGLSGGQKRRVAIAGILAIGTNILVFDEPTAGLDPVGENEMIDIILNEKKHKKTVFVVTHSMEQVLKIADEIVVIHNGKLVKSGTPYEVFLDKNIMEKSRIEIPKVIKTIEELVAKNKKFKALFDYKPRNTEELALSISKVLKGAK